MDTRDLITELESLETETPMLGDCGCSGEGSGPLAIHGLHDELASLEAELSALESGQLDDFELDSEQALLDLEDELEFATALGDDEFGQTPTLDDVISLAKQYPGLRISFGF